MSPYHLNNMLVNDLYWIGVIVYKKLSEHTPIKVGYTDWIVSFTENIQNFINNSKLLYTIFKRFFF